MRPKRGPIQALSVEQNEVAVCLPDRRTGLPLALARDLFDCSLPMVLQVGGGVHAGCLARRVTPVNFVMAIRAQRDRVVDIVGSAVFGAYDVVQLDSMEKTADAAAATSGRRQGFRFSFWKAYRMTL